ncbi:two-component system response regulator [Candidatus Planktophila limnetica]|uniref:Two-component system response regulator n=1 Tax=Candidatus Planktophila limnetica TaxID=573600 RepID=A0A249LF91_9ACTN|nr:response regulator transcription factor [Candidatus Planktophila limnetica]ASY27596.1 two-component system response regulator [Candidatus Planktophila limnetica]
MKQPLTVLIIDDHESVRAGVKVALARAGHICVGEAATIAEARAQIAHTNPQIIVVDLSLPDGNGLEIVTWARSLSQRIGIVVLTLNSAKDYLLTVMKSGASAYVEKNAPLAELISAIEHSAISPLSFSAQGISGVITRDLEANSLTHRETQVLQKLADGLSAGDIGLELFITQATVKTHLASIYRKLESKNRIQAIIVARKNGLLIN